jgi:general secretion pathway protein K
MSLGFGLNEAQISELLAERGKNGISDFAKLGPVLQKLNIRAEQLTLESQYFLSIASVNTEDLKLTSYAILKRKKDKNGKISVSLLSESLNAFD